MSDSLLNETVDCPSCGGNGTSDGGDCARCGSFGTLYVCCGHPVDHDHHCEGSESLREFKNADHTISERLMWLARGNSGAMDDASLAYAAELLEAGDE